MRAGRSTRRGERGRRVARNRRAGIAREAVERALDDPVLAAEQQEVIEKAIKTLPEPFRDVYVLADVEGLPNSEIGDILES